jgi:hypothetical protein
MNERIAASRALRVRAESPRIDSNWSRNASTRVAHRVAQRERRWLRAEMRSSEDKQKLERVGVCVAGVWAGTTLAWKPVTKGML